jgi:hypothetical protein
MSDHINDGGADARGKQRHFREQIYPRQRHETTQEGVDSCITTHPAGQIDTQHMTPTQIRPVKYRS